jgi:hypothetical protein
MGNPGYDVAEVTLSEALPNHALVLTLLTCGSGRLVGQPYFETTSGLPVNQQEFAGL